MASGKASQFESDFGEDIKRILSGCNAETKPLFETFVGKIRDRVQHLQREIESKGKNGKKPAVTVPADDGVDSAKMISESTLIAAFDHIQGTVPKCKLRIEFYRSFLALISQSKHMEHGKKTIIEYSSISKAICVPNKLSTITLFMALKSKIALKWRKSSIESVMLSFDDLDGVELEEEDTVSLQIASGGTKLPESLSGTAEELICRILSELSGLRLERHDSALFENVDLESKQRVYFVEPNVKHNKCQLFPLRSGLLMMPKPLRFVEQHRIRHFEFVRKAPGLRYGEMDIVLRSEDDDGGEGQPESTGNVELDKKAERERRKRRRANTITLEMMPNAEMDALSLYFQRMRPSVCCKQKGMASPQRECRPKDVASTKEEDDDGDGDDDQNEDGDGDHDQDDDGLSSDDEEYDPNEHDQTDSDCDSELSDDEDAAMSVDEEEDVDLDELSAVRRNCQRVKEGKSITTNRRKRNRKEMEKEKCGDPDIEVIELDGDSGDDLAAEDQENRAPRKRQKMSHQNGQRVDKEVIDKEQSAESEGKEPSVEVLRVITPKKKKSKKRRKSSPKSSSKKKRDKKGSKRSKKKKNKEKGGDDGNQKKISDLFRRKAAI